MHCKMDRCCKTYLSYVSLDASFLIHSRIVPHPITNLVASTSPKYRSTSTPLSRCIYVHFNDVIPEYVPLDCWHYQFPLLLLSAHAQPPGLCHPPLSIESFRSSILLGIVAHPSRLNCRYIQPQSQLHNRFRNGEKNGRRPLLFSAISRVF
jgi:hypothetical protein